MTRRAPAIIARYQPYLRVLLFIAIATGLCLLLRERIHPTNLVMPYLLVVVIAGLRDGRSPAAFAALIGVLVFDFLFVPPFLTFKVSDAQYLITFLGFLAVGMVIGQLTGQVRQHLQLLEQRERQTSLLYAFAKELLPLESGPAIAAALVRHVSEVAGQPALLWTSDGTKSVSGPFHLTKAQESVIAWTLNNVGGQPNQSAPLPGGELVIIPLTPGDAQAIQGPEPVPAVLTIRQRQGRPPLSREERLLVETLAAQGTSAFRRVALAEEARKARLLEESERLHDALLHSVSHALKTPLVSILGAIEALKDPAAEALPAAVRQELAANAFDEAERLHQLVRELLDMTRLQSGSLRLHADWYDLSDLVGASLAQAERSLAGHPIETELSPDLPLLWVDQVLIIQVLENLLANASKYSPAGTPIRVEAALCAPALLISVLDRGRGVPAEQRQQIFDRFFRLERPGDPYGTGLGLAICKGLVEAHGGQIWVEGRPGGGSAFRFTLPVRTPPAEEAAR